MASKPIQILSEAIASAGAGGAGAGATGTTNADIELRGDRVGLLLTPTAPKVGTVSDLGNGFQRLMIEFQSQESDLEATDTAVEFVLSNYKFRKDTWTANVEVPCTVLLDGSPVAGVLIFNHDEDVVVGRTNVPLKSYAKVGVLDMRIDVTVSTDILPTPVAYTGTPTVKDRK